MQIMKHYFNHIHYRLKAFNHYILATIYFISHETFELLSWQFAQAFFKLSSKIYDQLISLQLDLLSLIDGFVNDLITCIDQMYEQLANNFCY